MYLLAFVYLPPGSSTFDCMRFLSALEIIASQHSHHTLLVGGDFNSPNVVRGNDPLNFNFSAYTPPKIRESSSSVCETFSIFDAQHLYAPQPVKGYTLDLLFASLGCGVDLEYFDSLITRDCHHALQHFRICASVHSQEDLSVPQSLNYFKCVYGIVNSYFNDVDCDSSLNSLNVDARVTKLVSHAISSFVPLTS